MIRDMLNLINAVTITRETITNDGMGGTATVATTTTVARASIWQASSADRNLSDKVAKASTHVLAFEYADYGILDTDSYVNHDGKTYRLTGHADNVATRNRLITVGMERIS